MRGLIFLLPILSFSVASCSPMRASESPSSNQNAVPTRKMSHEVITQKGDIDWFLNQVQVRCGEAKCPEAVGVLLFVSQMKDHRLSIDRCTASLIAPDRILTAGHCDGLPALGYFVASTSRGRQIGKIKALLYKNYHPEQGIDSPDLAIFSLEQSLSQAEPASVLRTTPADVDKMVGFVSNHDGDQTLHYEIDRLECVIHRQEMFFPFDISESPNLLYGFDCDSREGNSGAPFFVDKDFKNILAVDSSHLVEASIHKGLLSTNVSCFDLPDLAGPSDCARVSHDEIHRRFDHARTQVLAQLHQRQVVSPELDATARYRPWTFELQTSDGDLSQQFEVLYTPTCRLQNKWPASVDFPSEHVELAYDDWGIPYLQSLGWTHSQARVLQMDSLNQRLELQIQWQPPFGPLLRPEEHPRKKWGNRFPIDLPVCTS